MEDDVRTSYEAVCSELNIDEGAKDSAWQEYQAINNDYVLEGPHIEWLACALYIACRSSVTQTVEGNDYTGNSISLTQILRATKLRLVEFFRKIKKWLEMARLPPVYLEKVEALERKFEVISVIFNKYSTEFSMLFAPRDHLQRPSSASGGSSSRPRSRKPNKAKPCTSSQLFEFGWVLYIHIKNQFPLISDDLVNSHYLLLCCLDMLCAAVITMKRKDLLNSSFDGFPEDFDSPSFSQSLEFTWVLSELCKKFAAIEKECLVVRDYYWWPSVRRLYETRSLQWTGAVGTIERRDVLQLLLSPNLFHSNLKTLNHVYELMVLQEGDFDERIFLNSPMDVECYNNEQRESAANDGMDSDSVPPGIIYQSPQHLQYGTPLTGREYLSSKDSKLTPVSDANQSVIQLHLLLEGCSHTLPNELVKLCSCCQDNPVSNIDSRLQNMSRKFLQSLKADSVLTPDNFALVRLQLSQSLYYKLLTAIVSHEEKKMAGSSQVKSIAIQNMLEHEVFQQSLFALCVEIVLFSYNSHSRIFPWILDVIEVNPFHFYKVIEVAIKVEHGFPRTVIKHLSKIEESVLSSLAWKTSSPLYELLDKVMSIPCYADVALPDSPITSINSPVTSRLKMSASKDNPSPLSVRERYSSPIPSVSRRQLFTGKRPPKSPTASPLKTPHPIAPKPPQGKVRVTRINPIQTNTAAAATAALINLIQQTSPQKADPLIALQAILAQTSPDKKQPIQPVKDVKSANDGQENSLPPPKITVTESPQKSTLSPLCSRTLPQPKRTGSVALFYRKVYQMSFLRIKDLCERLNLETEMLQKAWTCFEYSLMRSADLMRDRHIDQLIMCSIYVVAKVLRKEVTFQEIMRQYRHQPQAKSHVYRSVLLNNGRSRKLSPSANAPQSDCEESMDTTIDSSDNTETNAPPTSTASAIDTKTAVAKDSSAVLESILFKDDIEEGARGDIIQFYNKIFIGFVKDYVLKFTPDEGGPSCSMSPLPLIKRAPVSPRKLSKNHQIFVSPLKGSNQSSMSPLAKTFVISKSPASDLHELNQVVGSSGLGGGPRLMGARRQLDALLSRSPSSLIQRPVGNTTENTISRHIPPSISRIQTQHEPMNTDNSTSISSRTCNGDSSSNSVVTMAASTIQSSGGSNNHV